VAKFQVKLRKSDNPRWRAEPFKAETTKEIRQCIAETITKHGRLNKGSYQLSIKYKGGYGKNEDGNTWVINWEGTPETAIAHFAKYIHAIEEKMLNNGLK
jgi:hypothetical protein